MKEYQEEFRQYPLLEESPVEGIRTTPQTILLRRTKTRDFSAKTLAF